MNPSQISAVKSPAPWNLTLAGPGSGKTTVQVGRAKHCRDAGADPTKFAFLTFTNVAANVMRRRLEQSVGPVGFCGTLHSMMLTALRRDDPRWIMVGEEDAAEFIARHAKLLGYKGTADALTEARMGVWRDQKTLAGLSNAIAGPAARVIRSYQQFMRDEHLLDFNMVLTEGLKLLTTNRTLFPWTHWFVDEFQDSSPVDAEIYLRANPEELFITADPDQAIFAFRGARPANVRDFWDDGRFAHHVLDDNYRCGAAICDTANAVIALHTGRIEKKTVSATGESGFVVTAETATEDAEAAAVASIAQKWISNGLVPREVAILCRTNKLVGQLSESLRARGIPVAETESDRKPKDWNLLTLILSHIAAPKSWAVARLMVREQAKLSKGDVEEAERRMEAIRKSDGSAEPAGIWGFPSLKTILSCNASFARFGVGAATHSLLADRIRLFNPTTIEELLEALRTEPQAKRKDGVNVMTVHSAKGEEWDGVIVPAAEMFRSDDAQQMDEERRLFFVACTRARAALAITCARQRRFQMPGGRTSFMTRDPGELFEIVHHSLGVGAV